MSALSHLPLPPLGEDASGEGAAARNGATRSLGRIAGIAHVPSMPAIPSLPAMPSLPRMPSLPSLPRVPRLPRFDGVRGRLADVAAGASAAVDIVGEAARTLCSPTGVAGAALEALWLSTHVALYPFGLVGAGHPLGSGDHEDRQQERGVGYRIEHLTPVQRGRMVHDIEAAGTPILLVHGIVDNQSVFTLLRRGLKRQGFDQVSTMNYSILTGDVRVAAARLAQEVEAIVAQTGYERIHVVGHSMGGLIARYYVTRLGGDERVHTLVTLGSPHAGTYSAYAWPGTLTRQLRPGSPLMRELELPVPGCRTRFVCYWSDLDQIMFPQRTAALRHPDLTVTNILLHGVGHTSIPIMSSVVHGISQALAHLDEDGATMASDDIFH